MLQMLQVPRRSRELERQISPDDRCRDDIHPKQVNMTHALCAMKGALIRLLTRSDPLELLRVLITAVARTVEPIRPGRSSPRRKGPRLHGYHMVYKPCT